MQQLSRLGQHGRPTGAPAEAQRRRPRVRWGAEEQGSGRRFRRQAETEPSGLCDDAAQANQVPQGVLQLLQ